MRFESVTAYVFGPFRNETLDLVPGMNIVYGPNEAGKSTWHAALYAGLCGIRRGRGKPRSEDSEFTARHQPWDSKGWEVGAIVTLEDGRRIELRHDLAGRVDSSARDADMAGRDYSNEIMNDGAPDGAHWLGLDRQSFLRTAWVRQASILTVLEDPGKLQNELQRAAATARTGETAADALALLAKYRAEYVSTERAWTKPLAKSKTAVDAAGKLLSDARSAREEHAQRRREVERLTGAVEKLEQQATAVRAVLAEDKAESMEQHLKRARILNASFPEGAPRSPGDDGDLAQQVATALAAWEAYPSPSEPEGSTLAELQSELTDENLRLAVIADAEASKAEQRLARARELNASFPDGAPKRPSEDDALAQQIATALATWEARPTVRGPTVTELRRQFDEIDKQIASASHGGFKAMLRAIVSWFISLFTRRPRLPASDPAILAERRRGIERQIEDWEKVDKAADSVREAALAAGLLDDTPDAQAESLRTWQRQRTERIQEADRRRDDWEKLERILDGQTLDEFREETARRRNEAESRAESANSTALADALRRPVADEELAALKRRTSEARRVEITGRIQARRRAEEDYEEALRTHRQAAARLQDTARAIGSGASAPESQESALRDWQEKRRKELVEADRKREDWAELQRILGERSIDVFAKETAQLRKEADSLVASADSDEIAAARAGLPDESDLSDLDEQLREAQEARDTEHGKLTEFERGLLDVAEAEETLEAAKRKLERVERLNRTLNSTIEFLEAAQESVHRDIAPVLRETVKEHLSRVTGGRYHDCRIDPQSLIVEVADAEGRWRQANRLSHGTAEQLYLLLRLALARHLTKPAGEICPLILDDAVSAADGGRKRALLEVLLAISESVQVILFTHEDDVRAWAEERLSGTSNQLKLLSHNAASA